MCKYLLPQKLREVMADRIEFDKTVKKDVKAFVKLTRTEAISCQTYASASTRPADGSNDESDKKNRGAEKNGRQPKEEKKTKLPICLYPPHQRKGVRHRLHDCRACPEDEKPALLDKSKAEKAAQNKNQGAKRVMDAKEESVKGNSVTFQATYGDKLYDRIVADIGADANLADTALISRIQQAGGSHKCWSDRQHLRSLSAKAEMVHTLT